MIETKAFQLSAWDIHGTDSRIRYWKSVERDRERFYRKNERRIRRAFGKQIEAVVKAVETGFNAETDAVGAIDDTKAVMEEAYRAMYLDVGLHFANRTYGSLKADPDTEQSWIQRIIALIREGKVAKMIKNVQDTTKDLVRSIIQTGVEEGQSIPNIARQIRKDWMETGGIAKVRATRIARTETIRASNFGSIEGARSAVGPEVKKMWIATPDERVRETHIAADGETVPIDSTFDIGGFPAEYPGDPQLPPEESINCRCTIGYKTPDV